MKVLITGAGGQLGQALQGSAPAGSEIVGLTSSELDIADGVAVEACLDAFRPDILINAAAYTAVDKAEQEPGAAYRTNAEAVGLLSRATRSRGAGFVHISTDFVFDGELGRPYAVDAPTAPLGIYGASKLRGEREAGDNALIVRTAWVYSSGGSNFLLTMLRLMKERTEIRVVCDQIGTPTWATSLAEGIWLLLATKARGIYHYTDSGVASWYDFAVAIQEEALAIGLLDRAIPVLPIPTSDFPTPARRPNYSVLDKSGTTARIGAAPHWRTNLRLALYELRAAN